jgi:hypothetical protein
MQGAQNLRSEAYLLVRCNDEGEAQRRRWTFYETINLPTRDLGHIQKLKEGSPIPAPPPIIGN